MNPVLSQLQKDHAEHIPRITDEVFETFEEYNFYYIKKYKIDQLLATLPMRPKSFNYKPTKYRAQDFYNLSYKFLEFYDILPEYDMWANGIWWLVTNLDKNGVISPVNCFDNRFFHPGGKRVRVAKYLGYRFIPVVLQTKKNLDYKRIETFDKLHELYGRNCSFNVRDSVLEVSWHGSTGVRDAKGYDGWWHVSEKERYEILQENKIPKILLKNGLDVETGCVQSTKKNGIFTTNFVLESKSKIKIVLHDIKLINKDFWELFFHIDPTVYKKVCKSGKIEIINTYAKNQTVIQNCSLLDTIDRKNFFNKGKYATMLNESKNHPENRGRIIK